LDICILLDIVYISEDYIADSTFTNFNVVNVYEIINFEGIKNIFDYEEYKNLKAMKLNEQKNRK